VPLEAQACGTPVIAYGRGGAVETIRDLSDPKPTGVLFEQQTAAALNDALTRFETVGHRISEADCRENAERFGADRFRTELRSFVGEHWQRFRCGAAQE
jgi:glycosyltransferase involved in cell wall biosynthesis